MKRRSGADPDFPFLSASERFLFPSPEKSKNNSIIAVGGNLSPGMLLSAYEQGLFPWFCETDPILWHCPDPRFVILQGKLRVSSSMKKIIRRGDFTIGLDHNFLDVITSCSRIERPNQSGTWITPDIIAAYTELHTLGWAHSAEAYFEGELAGGCYGIRLGRIFFGESMFSRKPNASKAAFLTLARFLFDDGVLLIDCQQNTQHMKSLGAEEISRSKFLSLLRNVMALRPPDGSGDRKGNWGTFLQSLFT